MELEKSGSINNLLLERNIILLNNKTTKIQEIVKQKNLEILENQIEENELIRDYIYDFLDYLNYFKEIKIWELKKDTFNNIFIEIGKYIQDYLDKFMKECEKTDNILVFLMIIIYIKENNIRSLEDLFKTETDFKLDDQFFIKTKSDIWVLIDEINDDLREQFF